VREFVCGGAGSGLTLVSRLQEQGTVRKLSKATRRENTFVVVIDDNDNDNDND
jgi:hypothetical protein